MQSEKKNVLSRWLKIEVLCEGSHKHLVKELHVDGPVTANIRPAYMIHRCGRTISWWLAAWSKDDVMIQSQRLVPSVLLDSVLLLLQTLIFRMALSHAKHCRAT